MAGSKSRGLRFCMITTFYPPYNFGGDGLFVERLSRELADRGHTVDVVHCVDSFRLLGGKRPDRDRPRHPGVTVHPVSSPLGLLSPVATQQTGLPWFKSRQIRRVLERGHDVIHYHNVSLVGGPGILRLGSGIKLYTTHEYWLVCQTHVMYRFNRSPCQRPLCLPCALSHRRPPQLWRQLGLLQSARREIDAFISPCRFGIDLHRRMGFEAPMVHIPNFVPPVSAEPERWQAGDASRDPYFLFVGRLEKIKGLHTIIPLFKQRRRARLLVVGSGSYERQLRKLAGDSSQIRFLGQMAGSRLRSLFRDAVALIVPSVCYEVFALVIAEAFRERTPALVRNLGGMPELISASGGGVAYDTEDELSTWIDRLIEERPLRDELGVKGHSAYQREWTVEAHLERYFALIHELERTGLAAGRRGDRERNQAAGL